MVQTSEEMRLLIALAAAIVAMKNALSSAQFKCQKTHPIALPFQSAAAYGVYYFIWHSLPSKLNFVICIVCSVI